MTNDNKGTLAIVIMACMAIIVGAALTYVGFFSVTTVANAADGALVPTAATGVLTGTDAVKNGELVNITSGSTVWRLEFNITNNGLTSTCSNTRCIVVNVSDYNTGLKWHAPLVTAINNNASLAALVTATNTTTSTQNSTTVTYDVTGLSGNDIVLSENVVNASWSGTRMTGGVDGSDAWAGMQTNVNVGFTMTGIIIMLLGAAGLISVLFKSFPTGLR